MDDYQNLSGRRHEVENRTLRAALAGDAKAKAQIEAKDLHNDAQTAISKLRDQASRGDRAAISRLRQIATGAGVGTGSGSSSAAAAVGAASSAATAAERQRVADVFASPHSRGRERGCVALLTASKGWSAAAIVAELPNLPTDAERGDGKASVPTVRKPNACAGASTAQRDRSDAIWDRANSRVPAKTMSRTSGRSQQSTSSAQRSDSVWDRANAKIKGASA